MTINDKIKAHTARRQGTTDYEQQIKFISTPEPNLRLHHGNRFFNRSVEKLNSEETTERFKVHYTNPNDAIDLVESIWAENSKVWQANDKRVQFSVNRESKTEAPDLLWWWQEDAWEAYKLGGNSFGVVLPPSAIESNGGKFAHLIPAESVLFYENKDGVLGATEVVEFCYLYEAERGVYMGRSEYATFDYKQGEATNFEAIAPYWYNTLPVFRISSKLAGLPHSPDTRTNSLASLYPQFENYLYENILSSIGKGFGFANVIERIKTFESCGYSDTRIGGTCENGYMHSVNGEKLLMQESGASMPCPNCNSSIAVGKVVNIPIRAFLGKDANQPMKAVNFVSPDVTALVWAGENLDSTRKRLFSSGTGKGSENQIANNNFNSELSLVMAGETQHSVLMGIRKTLENNIYHSAKIVGELYFLDNFKDVFVSLGEKFSLFTREQLVALKTQTDALGLSDALRIDEQLVTSTANGDAIEERRGTVIMLLNKLIGAQHGSKLLTAFEILKMKLNAFDSKFSAGDLVKQILLFGEIDITSLYLHAPQEQAPAGLGEKTDIENE